MRWGLCAWNHRFLPSRQLATGNLYVRSVWRFWRPPLCFALGIYVGNLFRTGCWPPPAGAGAGRSGGGIGVGGGGKQNGASSSIFRHPSLSLPHPYHKHYASPFDGLGWRVRFAQWPQTKVPWVEVVPRGPLLCGWLLFGVGSGSIVFPISRSV